MKKYFIIVFWKALKINYKSFFLGIDCRDILYVDAFYMQWYI